MLNLFQHLSQYNTGTIKLFAVIIAIILIMGISGSDNHFFHFSLCALSELCEKQKKSFLSAFASLREVFSFSLLPSNFSLLPSLLHKLPRNSNHMVNPLIFRS